MIIGIDVSRNRSGGATAHIIGILNEFDSRFLKKIKKIHIWGYKELIELLPEKEWLVKHIPTLLSKSIVHQLYWQYYILPKEAKKNNIDIMLNTDAGTICPFQPAITMSRDMLSYEEGEMDRYCFGFKKMRLYLLRYLQNKSLTKSTAAIFLTKYASRVIQSYSGAIQEYKIIPHGVSDSFRVAKNKRNRLSLTDGKPIQCVYVSNVDYYKHQWNVAEAIACLRKQGFNICCTFIGGGQGFAQQKFERTLSSLPHSSSYIKQLPFLSHDTLPSYLQQYDIFIFASSCENMPNTLIEGMSSGLPIACSDRGPMPEVLENGGIYFDPEKVKSISKSLIELVVNDKKRIELAEDSFNLSKQYSWRRCSYETFSYLIKIHDKQ